MYCIFSLNLILYSKVSDLSHTNSLTFFFFLKILEGSERKTTEMRQSKDET